MRPHLAEYTKFVTVFLELLFSEAVRSERIREIVKGSR